MHLQNINVVPLEKHVHVDERTIYCKFIWCNKVTY